MPAGNTYEAIATQTLGSAAASVTFSSIPGTYTDLVLVASTSTTHSAATNLRYKFNGSSASIYSGVFLTGDGSSAASSTSGGTSTFGYFGTITNSATEFGVVVCSINNYSNATTFKTTLSRANYASGMTSAVVGLAQTTSAVSSLLIQFGAGDLRTGSTFSLYGIASA